MASSCDYIREGLETIRAQARSALGIHSKKDQPVRGKHIKFRERAFKDVLGRTRAKSGSQQQCEADVPPPRPVTGAMSLQHRFTLQQSYPQQLVQLVGHREPSRTGAVRPKSS